MAELSSIVYLVDDDRRILNALTRLLQGEGWMTVAFNTADAFLEAHDPTIPGCAVLDLMMPGTSGLAVQAQLQRADQPRPVIFLSGRAEIATCATAMKAGAVDFLTKPVRDQTLLDAVGAGIQRDIAQRTEARLVKRHAARFALLTPRERQVLREVVQGRLNKQIAFALGISVVTVKLHRGNAMKKMQAVSVGELVRIWETLPAVLRDQRPPGPRCDSGRKANGTNGRGSHPGVVGEDHPVGQSAVGSDRR
jgi:FixJ family two-component response regulator